MKKLVTFFLLIAIIFSVNAQKKKEVQSSKLKSTTVLVEDFEDNNGKQVRESYVRFDDSGNTVEEISNNKKGEEKEHILYEYDENGNKTKETYLKPNGTKEKTITYTYKDGLRVERVVYLPNGKIKNRKKYVYDFQK
jgi:uncharacterized protein YxeA